MANNYGAYESAESRREIDEILAQYREALQPFLLPDVVVEAVDVPLCAYADTTIALRLGEQVVHISGGAYYLSIERHIGGDYND
jgi:hypothetical protein